MIFLLVGVAGYRRRGDTGSNTAIVVVAIALTALVLGFFAVDTVRNAPETFTAIVVITAASVVLDTMFRQERPAPEEVGRPLPGGVPRIPRGGA